MSKKVQFIKQEQPKFIQQFKEKVGLTKGHTLEDKKSNASESGAGKPQFDERSDDDDEKPVVVVLKEGDLTKDEAEKEPALNKKILYKKPDGKRPSNSAISSSTKKIKANHSNRTKEKLQKCNKSERKEVSHTLLSFNECDDDYG